MPASPSLADWLARLENPGVITLGLDRVRAVRDAAGLTPRCPVLTVGGTNGKGSTCALLEAILGAAGYKTGLYSSPHLLAYNERVRLGGRDATDAELIAAFEKIEHARGETALSYFEFGTLAAMQCFVDAGVDVVLLEVGLGGRLDAVNIWDADAAIVTSVDFDHMDYLGDTLDLIGYEKAGIYRAARPAICSMAQPPARLVAHAHAIAADFRLAGREFMAAPASCGDPARWDFVAAAGGMAEAHAAPATVWRDLPRPALAGDYQLANAAGALAALAALAHRLPIDEAALHAGLARVTLRGRFQTLATAPELIVDVAHNPEAARALASVLRRAPRRTLAVVGMLADKDIAGTLATLVPEIAAWWTITPDSPRACTAAELAASLQALGAGEVVAADDYASALAAARSAARAGDRILAFGSFYTVAAALSHAAAQP